MMKIATALSLIALAAADCSGDVKMMDCNVCLCTGDTWSCTDLVCGEGRAALALQANGTAPTPEQTKLQTTVTVNLSFGNAPEGTTSAALAKDAAGLEKAVAKVSGGLVTGVVVVEVCIGTDCTAVGQGTKHRAVSALESSRAMTLKFEAVPVEEPAAGETFDTAAFTAKMTEKVKEDLASPTSALKASTTSTGAFSNVDASAVEAEAEAVQELVPVPPAKTPEPAESALENETPTAPAVVREAAEEDDDLSGGEITGIVMGSIAFVLIVVVAAVFVTGNKPAQQSAKDVPINEPIDEAV